MEDPERNVDMLEGQSNTESLNQEKNSGSIDQSAAQNEDQKNIESRTTISRFPGAPSGIKISKTSEGANITWQPPDGDGSDILEYAVYLAVRSETQKIRRDTTNEDQLAFVRVFCGPTNGCLVGINTLNAAYIDTTTKAGIIFRISAKNAKGYGPATQVKWLYGNEIEVLGE